MSDADTAFAKAQDEIARAQRRGAKTLRFVSEAFRALDRLPEAISSCKALRVLDLNNTSVSDLTPLSGLTGLKALVLDGTNVTDLTPLSGLTGLTGLMLRGTDITDLSPLSGLTELKNLVFDHTPVTDLRPIRGLHRLAEEPSGTGLTFKDCAACKADPEIARISVMAPPEARAAALFDYLEDWVPPGEAADGHAGPAEDALFPVRPEGERLEIAASTPSQADREERLKQVLHQRLQAKAAALAIAAGNRFFRLAARARAVVTQVERPFGELDLLLLHLAVEDLRDLDALGREEEEGEAFTPEVQVALGDVLRLGPGLTLGHADVDLLVERANARRASAPVPDEELAAQDAMSRAVAGDARAVGDRLRTLEEQVAEAGSAEAKEAQKAVNRNVLRKVGIVAVAGGMAGEAVTGVVVDGLKDAIRHLVAAHGPVLMEAAATYGVVLADWFAASIAQIPDLPTATREAIAQWNKHRGR